MSRHLTDLHCRQVVHAEMKNIGKVCYVAHSGLAIGRFLGKTQKPRKNNVKMAGKQSNFIHTRHSSSYSIKIKVNNSPSLVSSPQIRIERVSNPKNTHVLCLHSQDWFSTPIPLCSACQLSEPH